MTLNKDELKQELYGDNGLYKRVVDKIEEIGPRESSIILGVSTQQIWLFRKAFSDNTQRTRSTTIIDYADKLGVE
jgi:hypothetical protein